VTDSEEIIRKRRPLAEYWPETIEADLARYPPVALLRQQMAETGFVDLEEHGVEWTVEITDAGPYRDKAFSCLHLISEGAFQRGLQRFEKALDVGGSRADLPIPACGGPCLYERTRGSRQFGYT
jgi:hypothetical protein